MMGSMFYFNSRLGPEQLTWCIQGKRICKSNSKNRASIYYKFKRNQKPKIHQLLVFALLILSSSTLHTNSSNSSFNMYILPYKEMHKGKEYLGVTESVLETKDEEMAASVQYELYLATCWKDHILSLFLGYPGIHCLWTSLHAWFPISWSLRGEEGEGV